MAKRVVIKNPIINSPFEDPGRHFRFDEEGITDQIIQSRRISSYFVPVARPKKKGKEKQRTFQSVKRNRRHLQEFGR